MAVDDGDIYRFNRVNLKLIGLSRLSGFPNPSGDISKIFPDRACVTDSTNTHRPPLIDWRSCMNVSEIYTLSFAQGTYDKDDVSEWQNRL